MENLKIDENHLKDLANLIRKFLNETKEECSTLINNKADIFERFMVYSKFRSLICAINIAASIHWNALFSGHTLKNEIFHTKEGIKNGWDKCNADKYPFFESECTCEHEHENDEDLFPKEFIDELMGAIRKEIVN